MVSGWKPDLSALARASRGAPVSSVFNFLGVMSFQIQMSEIASRTGVRVQFALAGDGADDLMYDGVRRVIEVADRSVQRGRTDRLPGSEGMRNGPEVDPARRTCAELGVREYVRVVQAGCWIDLNRRETLMVKIEID